MTRGGWASELDPRAPMLATLAFLLALASQDRFAVEPLLALSAFPVYLALASGAPLGRLARRAALALPFALAVGAFNPWLDRRPAMLWGMELSAGWISFLSILVRGLFSVGAALALFELCGAARLARGLSGLGAPRVFVDQLLMFGRYASLLRGEARRLSQAHALRAPGAGLPRLALAGTLLGGLLLRSLDRAGRVRQAMLCRLYTGELPEPAPPRWGLAESGFLIAWTAFFLLLRAPS